MRLCLIFASVLAAGALVGCADQMSSGPVATPASIVTGAPNEVVLSVPEMTCPHCAGSIVTDLAKIEGVSDVRTDVEQKLCTFRVENPQLDLKAKLDEIAESNISLKGWSQVKSGS